jgi:outer membrane receptor protein involved in Fe transport
MPLLPKWVLRFYMHKRYALFCLIALCAGGLPFEGYGQKKGMDSSHTGIITGTVLDRDKATPLTGAMVTLSLREDTLHPQILYTVKDGSFLFEGRAFGWYRLRIRATGYATLVMDSIHVRADRFDLDLNDILLRRAETQLEEVVIYAEKPLVEERDGKIIFNSGTSALSAGATGTELLKQTPLVTVDNDGKVLLRGKETKILIDDKPVELNARQLQDLLESMPGSMIERIEVMTNPPPQYANERGGVVNIVTKKGKVGISGRVGLSLGTRGEAGITTGFSYRKKKWALNWNGGFGYADFDGSNFSNRQNRFPDSVSYFNTNGINNTRNNRPNMRLSVDYEINKQHALNLVASYNSTDANNSSATSFANLNTANTIYRLSKRYITGTTMSHTPALTLTYTRKFKNPRGVLRWINGANLGRSRIERDFFQQFLHPDNTPTGTDSTQEQDTRVRTVAVNSSLNIDYPLSAKWLLNSGGGWIYTNNHNILNTFFLRKPDGLFIKNMPLSNDFRFRQGVTTLRAALRWDFAKGSHFTAGVQAEATQLRFSLESGSVANRYFNWLPFATMIKKWEDGWSITLSYKRTIQRPRLNELNPSVDYADPYNTRFGNPYLQPYQADNFDCIVGKWQRNWYLNGAVGYNSLTDIYSTIRQLQPDGKTTTTWQNISGRKEYECSIWGGYTLSKQSKVNISSGYTYNVYSDYDRRVNRFRNGGALHATLNGNYQFTDRLGSNGSFTFNRFANPQGRVQSNLSMNLGVQYKLLQKKMTLAVNIIDPFQQQRNRNLIFGTNFFIESQSLTQTRNLRLAVNYIFSKNTVKKGVWGKGKK